MKTIIFNYILSSIVSFLRYNNQKICLKIVIVFLINISNNMYSQDFYSFTKDSKKGLVDSNMNVVIKPNYEQISTVEMISERFKHEGCVIFKLNNKYGIMNLKEKIILSPKYDRLYPTDLKNIFSFERGDIGGLVNLNGKELFAESYSSFSVANNNKSIIKSKKQDGHRQWSILNRDGSLIRKFGRDTIIFSSNYYDFSSKIFIYRVGRKYGYVDSEGIIKTKALFDEVSRFHKKYAIVKYKKKDSDFFLTSSIINKNGEFANNLKYQSLKFNRSNTAYGGQKTDMGFYYFRINGKVGLLDENLSVIVEPKYSQIGKFSEGRAFVADENGKYGFINTKGKEVIPLIYDNADFFSENLAPVVKNGKWGFIDKNNNVVIDFKYTGNMKPFSNGVALFRKNEKTSKTNSSEDKCGFINKKGEFIIEPIFYNAKDFKNGVALVGHDGFYYLIDKKGNRFKLYQDEFYHKEAPTVEKEN